MKKFILLLILLLSAFIVFKFGRSFYMPMVDKIKVPETVLSIIEKIEVDVLDRLKPNFELAGIDYFPMEIILAAFKEEKVLQVYAQQKDSILFIKEYPFTASSGKLGPKLKEGDQQIPEGIYKVEYLNPNSSYYLSIKVNYPNEFDRSKSKFSNIKKMGGDIFIHGKSASIGCIPIGDTAIEEVFLMTQKAINKEVKVIISPRDFRVDASYPTIESIDWEKELYATLSTELNRLPIKE